MFKGNFEIDTFVLTYNYHRYLKDVQSELSNVNNRKALGSAIPIKFVRDIRTVDECCKDYA